MTFDISYAVTCLKPILEKFPVTMELTLWAVLISLAGGSSGEKPDHSFKTDLPFPSFFSERGSYFSISVFLLLFYGRDTGSTGRFVSFYL